MTKDLNFARPGASVGAVWSGEAAAQAGVNASTRVTSVPLACACRTIWSSLVKSVTGPADCRSGQVVKESQSRIEPVPARESEPRVMSWTPNTRGSTLTLITFALLCPARSAAVAAAVSGASTADAAAGSSTAADRPTARVALTRGPTLHDMRM